MKKKIIIHGGRITSKNDGDIHYVDAGKLAQLYGINPKKHEVVLNGSWKIDGIHLSVRYDGTYKEKAESLGLL